MTTQQMSRRCISSWWTSMRRSHEHFRRERPLSWSRTIGLTAIAWRGFVTRAPTPGGSQVRVDPGRVLLDAMTGEVVPCVSARGTGLSGHAYRRHYGADYSSRSAHIRSLSAPDCAVRQQRRHTMPGAFAGCGRASRSGGLVVVFEFVVDRTTDPGRHRSVICIGCIANLGERVRREPDRDEFSQLRVATTS